MLRLLHSLLKRLDTTLLHPQWITNYYHNRKKQSLSRMDSKNILDIGSGDSSLKKYVKGSNKIVSIDYPTTNILYTNKPQAYADARNLPFSDKSFDAVILFEVLEHIFEDESVIKETHRVLNNDGQLYISVPFMYPIHDAPHDFRRYTKYGLSHILSNNGYHIESITTHGNSIVSSLQLFNLAILDTLNSIPSMFSLLTLFFSMALYPLTIFINLLSLPLLNLKWNGRMNLGYTIIATPIK